MDSNLGTAATAARTTTLFRLRFSVGGGHTHVRVFAGIGPGSLGKCGDLCFRNEEWAALRPLLGSSIEVLEESA